MAERKERHERRKRIAAKRKAEETPAVIPERSDVAGGIAGADAAVLGHPGGQGRRAGRLFAAARRAGVVPRASGVCAGQRGGDGPSYEELVETEGRPRLRYWLDRLSTEGILQHAAVVYGYFPAVSEGDDVVVLTEPRPDAPERYRFTFPRQQRSRFLCIADFFRSRKDAIASGEVDVLPFQLVTMGQPIADFANELFASNSYRDYLEVHGIGVQLTEALAEYWHRRVREELAFSGGGTAADEDPDEVAEYFKLGVPRCSFLVRVRCVSGSRGSDQDRRVARARAHRGGVVGGVAAAS